MRIGLVIYGSLDIVSGGYLYDRMLVNYLRQQGEQVDIIAIPRRNYALQLADNFSAALSNRLARAELNLLLQDELNHPSLFWLNERLSRKHPGAGDVKKISIVHHMRSSEDHPIWLLKLYRRVECHYLRSVDGFIFNSQSTRQSVEALINSRPPALVAPPSGAEFQLSISADEILARARQSGPLKLLFVGNIIPRKGLHILLDALQRTPDGAAALTVVGNPAIDRGYTNALLRQVKRSGLQERVSFAGQLSRDELAGQLRAHHVLAVPSTYEGFGIVYLEGMGFGLPAIGTTSGGAAEIITDSTDGFLVAPGDSEALGRLLVSLHQDRSRLARMSLAARQRYRSHPGWEETCAAIHAFLRCQINPQPGTGQRREMQAAPVTFPCGGAS